MRNILVVGGAGYVGGAVTDRLRSTGNHVRVYDNLLYEDMYLKDVDFVYGDLRDQALLSQHLNWADVVVWLAAFVGDGACQLNPTLTVEVNELAVQWLTQRYDGRIIFMSTCSVYGAQEGELKETSEVNPLSLYAATKFRAEQYLANKNAIIFRLGTLFGVGDAFSRIRMDLVVNTLTVRAFSQKKINVFGGEQYRPLLHVKDVANAVANCLTSDHIGVFNLHKENVRILDLAKRIQNQFPDCLVETSPMPFQDTRNYRVSSEKAEKVFAFDPTYSIEAGIEEIKRLIEGRRIKNFSESRYINSEFLRERLPGLAYL